MNKEQNNIARVLGQKVDYPTTYDKTILVREERATNRQHINIKDDDLPFVGFDTWNGYEFTCLMDTGIPVAGLLKLCYPCDNKYIVESKSLKLYLNSFNFYKCGSSSMEALYNAEKIIKQDLSELLETDVNVTVQIYPSKPNDMFVAYDELNAPTGATTILQWENINDRHMYDEYPNDEYVEDPSLLQLTNEKLNTPYQALYCNTLFSRCKVTKQPDHGEIYIYQKSDKVLNVNSVLKYITSIRNECHFHEEICETVYSRLRDLLGEDAELMVICLYSRRGGIDINPVRASNNNLLDMFVSDLRNTDIYHSKSLKQ